LHTHVAAGAFARMVVMGVPPFLLASSLILAQAQRLFRRLCPVCRQPAAVPPEDLVANRIPADFFAGVTVYDARGCPKCNDTGFKGRGAMMEVLSVTNQVREAIMRGMNSAEIRSLAMSEGMVPLKEVGMRKVRDGVTSLAAALEVTGGD
jgi:type II secretory ATPase GspE/PulE/Tfp pilus assembly ATPase PilB-like protein